MRKNLKMLLTVCAFAFAVLLVSGTQSKAATNMKVRQTDAGSSSITLEWNGPIADHYDVQFSNDGMTNWETVDYTFSQSILINRLSSGRVCYARVVAMNGSHGSSETIKAVSETVTVSTSPAQVQNLTQTGATTNSISMSWSPVDGASSYKVYVSVNYDWQEIATSTTTSVTINGVGVSGGVRYCVAAVRNVTGGQAIGIKSEDEYMKTVPAKVSRIAMTDYWDSLAECKYVWTPNGNADGYEYQVQKANGKKVYIKGDTISSYAYAKPFPKGVFVRARVRAYIKIGTKKLYGPWSGYTYSAAHKKMTAKRIANGRKISLKWKKISGACGYKVYISTKSNSGFKKVKTLSGKKTKYTITKCGKKKLKKKKTYYVRVKYMTKVGKKKVTSSITSSVTSSALLF